MRLIYFEWLNVWMVKGRWHLRGRDPLIAKYFLLVLFKVWFNYHFRRIFQNTHFMLFDQIILLPKRSLTSFLTHIFINLFLTYTVLRFSRRINTLRPRLLSVTADALKTCVIENCLVASSLFFVSTGSLFGLVLSSRQNFQKKRKYRMFVQDLRVINSILFKVSSWAKEKFTKFVIHEFVYDAIFSKILGKYFFHMYVWKVWGQKRLAICRCCCA